VRQERRSVAAVAADSGANRRSGRDPQRRSHRVAIHDPGRESRPDHAVGDRARRDLCRGGRRRCRAAHRRGRGRRCQAPARARAGEAAGDRRATGQRQARPASRAGRHRDVRRRSRCGDGRRRRGAVRRVRRDPGSRPRRTGDDGDRAAGQPAGPAARSQADLRREDADARVDRRGRAVVPHRRDVGLGAGAGRRAAAGAAVHSAGRLQPREVFRRPRVDRRRSRHRRRPGLDAGVRNGEGHVRAAGTDRTQRAAGRRRDHAGLDRRRGARSRRICGLAPRRRE